MKKTYAVLGAGMQGTAAAYDLAKFADAHRIVMGDVCLDAAQRSADRVNRLVGSDICCASGADALDPGSLAAYMKGVDVVLSCVPYWMHPAVASVTVAQGVSMVDLGGNTDVTMKTLEMDGAAKGAGVTLVPDTGLAPGLVNSLGLYMIENLDQADTVKMYCGVLPQHPKPPFGYKLTFHVEGLVTEYDYQATVVRGGEVAKVDTLSELETLEIEQLGTMEAFTTSGGTSTAPYTLKDRVKNYEYKTIRFPGHCERMRLYKDFGLWREDEIEIKGCKVRPKDVFCAVFGPELDKFVDEDQCAVRAVGIGKKDGREKRYQIDIFDRQCPDTGFTSMERLTGFSMSIFAIDVAQGKVPAGAVRYEDAMTGARFVEEIQRRGVELKFQGF